MKSKEGWFFSCPESKTLEIAVIFLVVFLLIIEKHLPLIVGTSIQHNIPVGDRQITISEYKNKFQIQSKIGGTPQIGSGPQNNFVTRFLLLFID